MLPSVGVEPLQFVGIDAAHHPWSEQSLKEAADPACAVPGRGDLHEGHVALRGDGSAAERVHSSTAAGARRVRTILPMSRAGGRPVGRKPTCA